MEDRTGDGVEQNEEGNERDDGVGGDAERERVNLTVKQIGYEGLAVTAPAEPLRP
jgi:hypothetical protein